VGLQQINPAPRWFRCTGSRGDIGAVPKSDTASGRH
jgi:hypothetical protein